RRRHAVRGKDHQGALGHFAEFFDEDRTALLELFHDVLVVHDLLADVHRRTVMLESLLYGDDGSIDARAVTSRRRQQDTTLSSHTAHRMCDPWRHRLQALRPVACRSWPWTHPRSNRHRFA